MKNNVNFESVDLNNNEVYRAQLLNAKKYEIKSLLGKVGLFSIVPFSIFMLSIDYLYENFSHIWLPTVRSVAIFGAVSLFVGYFGTLFLAKCPNCKTVQPGTGRSIFHRKNVKYTNGISPFAKKCSKCGFYLSVKELKKDTKAYNVISNRMELL